MPKAYPRRRVCAVLAVACIAVAGCKQTKAEPPVDEDDETGLAEDGADTNATEVDTEVLTSTLVSASGAGSLSLASASELVSSNLTPADLGDGAKLLYFPRGCLTVAHDPAAKIVTYGFDGCTGPNGLFRIFGEVKATYSAADSRLVLDLVGTGLRVNRATVDWSAHAEIDAEGTSRTMHWKATLAGTTARGRAFSRSNDKTITWRVGERCFALSGVSEGEVRARSVRTEIFDFSRCQGGCPESGGRIVITNLRSGKRVEIRFDGSSRATYSGPRGEGTFALACTER